VHDQGGHIAAIVAAHVAALARVPQAWEILLVVNGSTDDSLAVCREVSARTPGVRVLEREEPGWGGAVRLGLAEAKGDLLCYTNSARTTPEELVLVLLYAVAYPGVIVKANRKIRESWRRRLGSLVYNLECRALFDLSTWDINGTPKVFPRTFGKLLQLTHADDLVDAEFCVTSRREGYPMVEVPIFSTRRHGGRSTTRLSSAFRMYWGAWRMWRSQR
jgi:glycosyltransferase involved in cell wall biosynthesis